MTRKSSIRQLPKELEEEVNRLLADGKYTLNDIIRHLRALGVDNISRSALGRHKQRLDKALQRLRETREFTEAITANMHSEALEGKMGRSLVQLLQDMVHNYLTNAEADGLNFKEIQALTRSVKDIVQASRTSQDYEAKIREQIERESKEKMAKAVEAALGASESQKLDVEAIKRAINQAYGME